MGSTVRGTEVSLWWVGRENCQTNEVERTAGRCCGCQDARVDACVLVRKYKHALTSGVIAASHLERRRRIREQAVVEKQGVQVAERWILKKR